ncbi:hypothetical protein M4D79_26045 [Mycolicibacterium novocastrense]|nr:hypothetical protein M4D79_26045 [Mycolicibacterium novocastrense]
MGQDDVVGGAFLDEAGQRRVHDALVDAEFVHQLQPGCGRLEGRDDIHWLPDELAEVQPLGVVAEEVVLGAAWASDAFECGVGDHMADVVLDDQLGPPVDLDVADLAAVLLGAVDSVCSRLFNLSNT